jgi:hypothetical protein
METVTGELSVVGARFIIDRRREPLEEHADRII